MTILYQIAQLVDTKRYAAALDLIRNTRDNDPKYSKLFHRLNAVCYIQTGDPEKALGYAKKLADLKDPEVV